MHYARPQSDVKRVFKRRKIMALSDRREISGGYIRIRVAEEGKPITWPLEHRFIMEKMLGRKLIKGENVHHKDGNKVNNAPENLELWIDPQPTGVRVEDALKWAREIIARYG